MNDDFYEWATEEVLMMMRDPANHDKHQGSSFIADDISRELKNLNIDASVGSTMPRSKVIVTFKSREDMNLYKVSGSYSESDYLKFEVEK